MVFGAVLVLLGLVGFFSKPILGLFGVNTAQNVLHLVGGALGLWLASKGSGKAFNQWLGYIALVVGVLGFVPVAKDLLISIFAINTAISGLHVAVGVVSLGVAYAVKGEAAMAQ
jgi:hypothetical protein